MSYHAREITPVLLQALAALPAVVLTGARQTGKTTFLRHDPALAGRRYTTLDDFATLAAARRDPVGFLAGDEPLTVDEVQRCPELFVAAKKHIDDARTPGRFLFSGSANLQLLGGVAESLAGRALYLDLHPFTRREIRQETGPRPWLLRCLAGEPPAPTAGVETIGAEEVIRGGFPPAVLAPSAAQPAWFLGYEQTYLERDLRELSQVADLIGFRTLMRLAALRTGSLLNQSDLARDARLALATTSRYLGLLEASFLITRMSPHATRRTSRLTKSPKLYFADAGLAAHLSGVEDLLGDDLRGALLETWVAQNLRAMLAAHRPGARLEYWHVQGRHEVDFVITAGRAVLAIEVKASTRFGDRDLRGLQALAAKAEGLVAAILAYGGTEVVPLGVNTWAIPLSVVLS